MNIFGKIFLLILGATIISFLVALIIKLISVILSKLSSDNENNLDNKTIKTKIDESLLLKVVRPNDINSEIIAVITYALDLYVSEIHDFEKTKLTIEKTLKPYSPWSSKIYGLRNTPR